MCGFSGFLGGNWSTGADSSRALLHRMNGTIAHRGPDSDGYWYDADACIALGHRRLAIMDLSPAGAQPMVSHCGRYMLTFNGEIYNHLKLRNEMVKPNQSLAWRGHSDTETLLAGFSVWGIQATVERSIGMFAFALWDRQTRTLTLGRDRLGEKPVYYGWQGQGRERVFLFGSELKALKTHPAFTAQIDRGALCLMMRYNYIPAPYSIYQGIQKLTPGCLLEVTLEQREPKEILYWSLVDVANTSSTTPFTGSPKQAVDELEILLKSAVRQQMIADVPLGAFLSGGIDSSTIVALMQAQSDRPVKTFTIGFEETGYNEALDAKAVAAHLGTEHTELYVTPHQAMDVIPRLPSLYCEPFSDSSQIPTFLVSQLARQHVTVSLSGDAGDELFCGYNRYVLANRLWHKLSYLPVSVRRLVARGLKSVSPAGWDSTLGAIQKILPKSLRQANLGDKLHKGAGVLASGNIDAMYLGLVSHWEDPAAVVLDGIEPPTLLNGNVPLLLGLSDVQRMMVLDTLTYLPDDILVKVDRAAMGISLESRVPYLDHRVVEFAWRLPQSMKLRDSFGKWALREVLFRHVPKALIERPKMGFGVPIDRWLRGSLQDWVEALIDENRLLQEGIFEPAPIRKLWTDHLSGKENYSNQLWSILMFQTWMEAQK